VLFGATGYTGRLTVDSLIARGERPVLAGRDGQRLSALAEQVGGLPTAVADASDAAAVAALLAEGDVLITTVGPFLKLGAPAVQAAVSAGAAYFDSTGEPPFIRRVFEDYGPRADRAGLVTAFGYDYVPGNLAGALALRDAGEDAVRVDVGYFVTGGPTLTAASGGTAASAAGIMLEPGFAWRDGAIRTERPAARVRGFRVAGRRREGVSVGGSEHFALPRLAPQLRAVNVYLGWAGPLSRPTQLMSALTAVWSRAPGARAALDAVLRRALPGSTGGPDAKARARTGSIAVGQAYDDRDRMIAETVLTGPNGYTFTADILAWGASTAAKDGLTGPGALGPVDAFGLDRLMAGCAEVGLVRQP
jgi:short subunit dehydrogenase-like uncharacterized protein